jgi:hypothetical protein
MVQEAEPPHIQWLEVILVMHLNVERATDLAGLFDESPHLDCVMTEHSALAMH